MLYRYRNPSRMAYGYLFICGMSQKDRRAKRSPGQPALAGYRPVVKVPHAALARGLRGSASVLSPSQKRRLTAPILMARPEGLMRKTKPCFAYPFGASAFGQRPNSLRELVERWSFSPAHAPHENRRLTAPILMARPEGFEPPTPWFVARYSIQLSYGRARSAIISGTSWTVKYRWPRFRSAQGLARDVKHLEVNSPSFEFAR